MGEYLVKISDIMKISDMSAASLIASSIITVENEYIDKAMVLINRIVAKYPAIFENRVEYKNFNLSVRRILEYIRKNQVKYDTLMLSKSEILNASSVDSGTFDEAMTTLIESGKVMQLFAREIISQETHERIQHGKEVFIIADHYNEFKDMVDCDVIGQSARVMQLRNGTEMSNFDTRQVNNLI
jgi:hypothetical protein